MAPASIPTDLLQVSGLKPSYIMRNKLIIGQSWPKMVILVSIPKRNFSGGNRGPILVIKPIYHPRRPPEQKSPGAARGQKIMGARPSRGRNPPPGRPRRFLFQRPSRVVNRLNNEYGAPVSTRKISFRYWSQNHHFGPILTYYRHISHNIWGFRTWNLYQVCGDSS